jgi:phosphoheptose isomerase
MGGAGEYMDKALAIAHPAAEMQLGAIRVAAALVADALANGKTFWVFGTGHSRAMAEELYGRAGGLADVRVIALTSLAHSNAPTFRAPALLQTLTVEVVTRLTARGQPTDVLRIGERRCRTRRSSARGSRSIGGSRSGRR